MKFLTVTNCSLFFGMVFISLVSSRMVFAEETEITFHQETAISDIELSTQSGQGDNGSAIRSDGRLNNNTINIGAGGSVTNGNNVVGDQAFSNANGIPTIVQNSGNNVIIQNSTIVNMSFTN